ncbi:TPA: hypothetical protein ACGW44_005049, partial [Bacillus toyonensis]
MLKKQEILAAYQKGPQAICDLVHHLENQIQDLKGFWCKNSGFMRNEQKIPSGIELYAVKPNISLIRYICFWTDFSPWKV